MEYTIESRRPLKVFFRELFLYRRLLLTFAWRDLRLKYRQTSIGFAWVVLQPLIMMAIFTAVFASRIGTVGGEIPYEVFVFSGLIIYNVFSGGAASGSNVLVAHADIIKKAYFPRVILPLASVAVTLVDYLASLLILIVLMLVLGPEVHIFHFLLYSITAYVLAALPTLAFGLLFSTLNARYRDVNLVFPFLLQIMLFVSPVIYPLQTVENEGLRTVLLCNPLSGAMEVQKLAVYTGYVPDITAVTMSLVISICLLVAGLFVFNKMEKNFADII